MSSEEKTVTNLCPYSVADCAPVEGTKQCPSCKMWFCYGCYINYFLPLDNMFPNGPKICVDCHYKTYGRPKLEALI